MSSLSQASRLADLPSAHDAFQGHAAHIIEWPTMLRPKDSEGTCIPSGVPTFLQTASRRSPSQTRPLVSIWDGATLPTPVPGSPGLATTSRGCVIVIAVCVRHCKSKPRKAPEVPGGAVVSFWLDHRHEKHFTCP